VAESIGLGKPSGALIRGVEAGSPADKAGVEAGDIIVKFDGKVIEKHSDLPRLVGSIKPGTKSTVTVFRRGSDQGPEHPDRRGRARKSRCPQAG
jgi:serine protease Do